MVDRYAEDLKRAKELQTEVNNIYKERQLAQEQKKGTAKFDYKLKSKTEMLK